MSGHILVVTGGMFSGKSEQLIVRCKNFKEYGKKSVKVYKPAGDNRFSDEEVVSRTGYRFPATNIPENITVEVMDRIIKESFDYDVIGFDEAQFYSKNIMSLVRELAYLGKYVIIAGLNMDYSGAEFGYMGGLLAMSDEMIRLHSFCAICGSEKGSHTQRLVNGEPAKEGSPIVLIGDTDDYQPRCRECFIPPCKA